MTEFITKKLFVRATYIEPVLASTSNDKEIYTNFIAAKAPDAKTVQEELEDVGLVDYVDKQTTVFLHDKDGYPYLSNHVVKGFMKNAAKSIRRLPDKKDDKGKKIQYESKKMSMYVKKIEQLMHIYPRKLWLQYPKKDVRDMVEIFQRPLRASTPQGERIALASSEMLPEGTFFEFEIQLMDPDHEKAVREWLDFGFYHGISQWRNADYGRFVWKEISEEEFLDSQKKYFDRIE